MTSAEELAISSLLNAVSVHEPLGPVVAEGRVLDAVAGTDLHGTLDDIAETLGVSYADLRAAIDVLVGIKWVDVELLAEGLVLRLPDDAPPSVEARGCLHGTVAHRGIGAGLAGGVSGIISRSPIRRIRFRSVNPFACMIASTLTPYRWAIRFSVSPPSTTWVRCCGGASAGEGEGEGEGTRNGGGLDWAAGVGNGVTLAAGAGVDGAGEADEPSAQLMAKKSATTPTTSTAPRIRVYAPRAARSPRPRAARAGRPPAIDFAAPSGTA
jgi:hypothetical protein